MNRQEAEQLAERIRSDAPKLIVVVGIGSLGPASPRLATDFVVKCACKTTGLPFTVKSFEHWEHLNEHILVRLCKAVSRLYKGVSARLA